MRSLTEESLSELNKHISKEGMQHTDYDSDDSSISGIVCDTLEGRLYGDNQRLNKNLGKVRARLQIADERLRYTQLEKNNLAIELENARNDSKKALERLDKLKEKGKAVVNRCYWLKIQRFLAFLICGTSLFALWFDADIVGFFFISFKFVIAALCITGDTVLYVLTLTKNQYFSSFVHTITHVDEL